jgi:predicted lipoprotein
MNRVFAILGAIVAVGAFSWFFPLFHVVSRELLRAEKEKTTFHADEFVREFWSTKLLPALPEAADATTVLAALRESPEQARTQFGRTAGLGRSTLYFLRGNGTIVAVDGKQIGVALASDADQPDVALATGLLFGNTVRDATGLVNGDDFPNSQQFNEISAELNRTIETTVLPLLKERAKVGDAIEFVGCAEVTNVPRDITPLKIVPLVVKFE